MNVDRAKKWNIPRFGFITPLENPLDDFQLGKDEHMEALRARLTAGDVRLVVVDSLSGAAGGTDENTTAMLQHVKKLARLATDTGLPVLVLHHLNKALTDTDGVHLRQVRGSSSIIQAARVVWAIDEPDEQDRETRRISCIKSNVGRKPEPLGYRLEETGASFPPPPRRPQTEGAVDRAKEFLLAHLGQDAKPSKDVFSAAQALGISIASVRRAKEKSGVVSVKNASGHWLYSLPPRFTPPEY